MFKSRTFLAVAVMAATLAAPSAHASSFAAWEVADVDWNDVLNVRAWPSSKSAIRAAYPNGAPLQMTGRCMNGVDLKDISTLPAAEQAQLVRYTWCEVWHDPTGTEDRQAGWYIRPLQ